MAVAIVTAVSGGTEGRVAGHGDGLCWQCEGKPVPRGGVEQAAVGNQVRLRTHDQHNLTRRLHLTPRQGHRGWALRHTGVFG